MAEYFNFLEYVGCSVKESNKTHAILDLQVDTHHLQHLGYIHGGVISTLADNTAWFVLKPYLRPDQTAVTQELTVNYLRLGKGKTLTAIGKLVKMGRHSAFVTVELFSSDTLIATSSSHLTLLTEPSAPPKA